MINVNSNNNVVPFNIREVKRKALVNYAMRQIERLTDGSRATIDVWYEAIINIVNNQNQNK